MSYIMTNAFDKVSHTKLLYKMAKFGIEGPILKWTRNWLSNRKQCVVIENSQSSWRPVKSGIPQGSVLAAIMFSIYISSFGISEHVFGKKFADDTKAGRAIETKQDVQKFQDSITEANDWSKNWQMPINVEKIAVLHFGQDNPWFEYRLGDDSLGSVASVSDLGIIIDEKLDFVKHVECIVKKATFSVYSLNSSISSRDKDVYLKLYLTTIRPILEYALGSSI